MKLLMVPILLIVATSMLQYTSAADLDDDVNALRVELEQMELAILAGAGQLRNPNVDQESQERGLKEMVERSFDVRQRLQQAEAQRLRQKLEEVEKNLAARAKNRTSVIERRMQELQAEFRAGNVAGTGTGTANVAESSEEPQTVGNPPDVVNITSGDWIASTEKQGASLRELRSELRRHRDEFLAASERVKSYAASVEELSQSLEQAIANERLEAGATESRRIEELSRIKVHMDLEQRKADLAMRFWKAGWVDYLTQLRILGLEVAKARVKFDAAEKSLSRVRQLAESGSVSQELLHEKQTAYELQAIEMEQIVLNQLVLANLEKNEPELNPYVTSPPAPREGSAPAGGGP